MARAVVTGASLAAIADVLGGFLAQWLLAPGDGAALPARLAEALATACAGGLGKALGGEDALEVIEDELLALRVPRGRFGEPAVYVGTVAGAAGIDFEAVRVIGPCEGVLPSQPREDPVIPARRSSAPGGCSRAPRTASPPRLHGLVAAVQGVRAALALSAPSASARRAST